jgi:hypothetical protein
LKLQENNMKFAGTGKKKEKKKKERKSEMKKKKGIWWVGRDR